MKKCNHNCLECKFDDCINDTITSVEKMESNKRDRDFTNYGVVRMGKPQKSRKNANRHF